jgi:hypothetical protein
MPQPGIGYGVQRFRRARYRGCRGPAGGMLARAGGRLWVEVFEEDTIARAALARFPALRYCATKVAAGSELKGLYSDPEAG